MRRRNEQNKQQFKTADQGSRRIFFLFYFFAVYGLFFLFNVLPVLSSVTLSSLILILFQNRFSSELEIIFVWFRQTGFSQRF